MNLTRFVFAFVGVLSLCISGCGGGGGGDGGDSSSASFTIERTTVAFNSAADSPTPPAQQVNGTISNVDSTVFLTVTTTSNGVANATVQLTGSNTGTVTISAKSPADIGTGTFVDTVVVSACLDSACSRPIAGSPQTITVTHTVIAGTTSIPTFAIGGSVAGLVGSVVLQDNLGSNITVSSDGSFAFPSRRTAGDAYQVSVFTQPIGQTCVISAGAGVVATADVSSIRVNCSSPTVAHPIGGTVTGLVGSLVLTNNGGDNLTLSTDGTFAFATLLPDGSTYQVAVATQPPSQQCIVSAGSGTVAAAAVTNITVTCKTKYTVGGVTSGLKGTVVLQNNGGDDLSVSGNGTFAFATSALANSSYEVTVRTQPTAEFCRVFNGVGAIGTANVTGVKVICTSLPASKYAYLLTRGEIVVNGRTLSGGLRTITGVLAQFTIGPTGALSAIEPATVSGVTDPLAMAVDPSGQYAYVTTAAGSLLQYTIGTGGGLVAMNPASLTAGIDPRDITVDPTGRFAYVVNFGNSGLAQGSVATEGSISQYSIAADGQLVPMTPAEIATVDVNPNSMLIDPSGKYAYVAGSTLSRNTVILQYSIGSNGALTPMTPPSFGVGAIAVLAGAADPFGRSVYFVDPSPNSSIFQYAIQDNGGLMSLGTLTAQRQGPRFVIDPTGTYAYVVATGFIFRYIVNTDGTITLLPGMQAVDNIGCLAPDLSGKYFYACAGDPRNELLQFTVGNDGALTPMTPASVAVPLNPGAIVFSP